MEVVGIVVGVMPDVGEGFEWSAGGTDPSASIATVMLGNPFYRKTKTRVRYNTLHPKSYQEGRHILSYQLA